MLQTELGRLEERARREGRREGEAALQGAILDVIRSRFGAVPESVADRVGRVRDLTVLQQLVHRVAVADRLEEIEPLLDL
jgi:hypothetical protein